MSLPGISVLYRVDNRKEDIVDHQVPNIMETKKAKSVDFGRTVCSSQGREVNGIGDVSLSMNTHLL